MDPIVRILLEAYHLGKALEEQEIPGQDDEPP
jgi:hypothetical protein